MKPAYSLEYLNYLVAKLSVLNGYSATIKLKEGEYITDVEKFVQSHAKTVKFYIHNNVGKPYLRRLHELSVWMDKNLEK